MNKYSEMLPTDHSPLGCVVKTPKFKPGQLVGLAANFTRPWKGVVPGVRAFNY